MRQCNIATLRKYKRAKGKNASDPAPQHIAALSHCRTVALSHCGNPYSASTSHRLALACSAVRPAVCGDPVPLHIAALWHCRIAAIPIQPPLPTGMPWPEAPQSDDSPRSVSSPLASKDLLVLASSFPRFDCADCVDRADSPHWARCAVCLFHRTEPKSVEFQGGAATCTVFLKHSPFF